jgi:hypothetical protein
MKEFDQQRDKPEVEYLRRPKLSDGVMIIAFTGWMDGGDVSTGTVERLVRLLEPAPFAEINPEPFYIYNFPGSMEITAMFRPHIRIEEGLIQSVEMPTNTFYVDDKANIVLFLGKEPNLKWQAFGESIFQVARGTGVRRLLFVGSFGGPVPHTRLPRLYYTCSDSKLQPEMEKYGLRGTDYEGPGSFISYLMSQATSAGLEMSSVIAEIPGYLQGTNPMCIEAVTRQLANILKLPLDLDSLRPASTAWELEVTNAIEDDEDLAEKVRELENEYDNELIDSDSEESS